MMTPVPILRPALRPILRAVLPTDSDFQAFCLDYFPEAAEHFTDNMDRVAKANLLLETVDGQTLLEALRKFGPNRVAHYEHFCAAPSERANPYCGLAAFQLDEAHLFFGREVLTEKLWQRSKELYETPEATRLLAILGPSGSGKSSLARAGLLAALSAHPIPGPEACQQVVCKPGEHPIRALALALCPPSAEPTSTPDLATQRKLIDDLRQTNKGGELDGLSLWAANLPTIDAAPLVVLVDQLEEIYTLCTDVAERDAFVGLLLHAAADRAGYVFIVLTLRSDFLGETQRHHLTLNRLIAEQCIVVSGMSPEELRQAITLPAEQAGHPIDDATVELLLTEARGSTGALPLLEFALTRIWEGMVAGKEAGATLRELGGVGGALAGEARKIYNSLSSSERATVRRALVRLVQIGEGTGDLRRRRTLRELCGRDQSVESVLAVLRKLADENARLVTLSWDGIAAVAEVTHEALFHHWTELANWINESRADRRFHDRAAEAALLWSEAGRMEGRLWRSPDLDLLRAYQRRKPDELSPQLLEFLQAAERLHRSEKLAKRGAVAAVILAAAMMGALYVANARQQANKAAQASATLSRELLNIYVEQGRQLLLAMENPVDALPWLHRAQEQGSSDPILPELMRSALWSVDAIRAILVGHADKVVSARYSPDGSRIVTASTDKTARVWDTATGRQILVLKGHADKVLSARYSPDGSRVVTASTDKTARVWDAANGGLIAELKGHTAHIYSATFSPDGTQVVTAGADNSARVWEAETGKLIAELGKHDGNVIGVEFSPQGHRIVTSSTDKTARIWDSETGTLVRELKGHQEQLFSATYSPDGLRIVTASADDTARVWDAETGALVTRLKGHEDRVYSATFSPDGRRIVTASADNTARLWNATTGLMLAELKGHGNRVYAATYSPDGHRIVTASWDKTARIWDSESGRFIVALKGHGDKIWSATYSPNSHRIVTASADGTARIWDAEPGQLVEEFKGHGQGVLRVRSSPDGLHIVTASADKTARIWDAEKGSLVVELKGHGGAVTDAAYSPNGHHIVTASRDKTAQIWDTETGRPLQVFKGHGAEVLHVAYRPDGRRIVTASADKSARIWDAETGELIGELNGHSKSIHSAAYSPDGSRIVTASDDRTVRIWDAESRHLVNELKGHGDAVREAVYSPNGNLIVTASDDRTARIWDVQTGRVVSELQGHAKRIHSVEFSSDGQRIVTSSEDKTARIWEAKIGRLIITLTGHGDTVHSATFSHQHSQRVLTASDDKTVRIWDVSKETRSGAEIARRLRCFSPVGFEGKLGFVLVRAVPNPAECHDLVR